MKISGSALLKNQKHLFRNVFSTLGVLVKKWLKHLKSYNALVVCEPYILTCMNDSEGVFQAPNLLDKLSK